MLSYHLSVKYMINLPEIIVDYKAPGFEKVLELLRL